MTDQPATRLYLPTPLSVGAAIDLDSAQAHKLRNVLRLCDGAPVAAFNAHDGEFLCRLREQGRRGAILTIDELRRPPQTEADVWLVFAPIKRARLDWLIEKATELGASTLVPVWTERTQAERVNHDRLLAQTIAAAEQCERLSLPELAEAQPLNNLIATWPPTRRLIVCDETGGGEPIAAMLATVTPEQPAAILIGPEGGFAERELDALGKLPIVNRVGLGPRVLRAETAALAALAVFQAVAGDWRRVRPG